MRYVVKVHPSSKHVRIVHHKKGESPYDIEMYIKEKAENNEANKAVLKELKRLFGSDFRIVRGLKSKVKVVVDERG